MGNFFDAVKKAVVCTPNQEFDNNLYKTGVLDPYAQIEKMAAAHGDAPAAPPEDQVKTAISLLKKIFDTKRVEEQEQRERFDEILGPLGKTELSPYRSRA